MGVGLPYNAKVFSQAWQDGLMHIPETGMDAEVRITDPSIKDSDYDPATNTYTPNPSAVLYEGKARVQPIRSAVPKAVPGDNTTTQTVLVSIPIKQAPTMNKGFRVKVTASELNPDLLRYTMNIQEIMDSSNPLERTVLCEVNQEWV